MASTDATVIGRYAGIGGATASVAAETQRDLLRHAKSAPPQVMADALAHTFRSDQTPSFPPIVSTLFRPSKCDPARRIEPACGSDWPRLIVNAELSQANGTAERDAALVMLEQILGGSGVTLGPDKGYDTRDFVAERGNLEVTPHVPQSTKRSRGIAVPERTTRHPGYEISQKKRKRIEECCGWLKDIALLRKVQRRGIHKVGRLFTFAADTRMSCRSRLGLTCPLFGIMRVADFAGTSRFSAA